MHDPAMTEKTELNTNHLDQEDAAWPSPGYAWYVVIVLFLCSIFSFLDRQILSLLVEEIRRDLGLSEVQVGWLQGAPFAIFYATMSVPIALAADRLNRKNIIVILMSVELMLLAVNINLVAFSAELNDLVGQVFALFILTVAAAEVAIGLAIVVVYFRNRGSIAVEDVNMMKG